MARNKSAQREAREARERLRRFTARQEVHAGRVRRRRRDNVVALIAAFVVVGLAASAQIAFFAQSDEPVEPPVSSEPAETETPQGQNVGDIPPPELAEGRTWTGHLALNDVTLGIELDGAAAPQAVAAFVQQVRDGYFDGKTCHRLTDTGALLIQCGSLDGTGAGDPDFQFGPIENAPDDNVYPAGTIALARASGDAYSNGHQFFITYDDATIPADAAGGYTVFGRVTEGLEELIEKITSKGKQGDNPNGGLPVADTVITSVSVE